MLQNGLKFLKSFLIRSLVPGSSHGSGWSEIGKSFYPPPYFSLKHSHCTHRRESKTSSFLFALKCVLVCFALAFFVLAGTVYAQQTVDCETHTPGILPTDKDALIALYCATDGDNWTNKTGWLTDMPIHDWFGVWAPAGTVIELDLNPNPNVSGNNLTGTIPPELGNLTSLTLLYLPENNLTEAIPS